MNDRGLFLVVLLHAYTTEGASLCPCSSPAFSLATPGRSHPEVKKVSCCGVCHWQTLCTWASEVRLSQHSYLFHPQRTACFYLVLLEISGSSLFLLSFGTPLFNINPDPGHKWMWHPTLGADRIYLASLEEYIFYLDSKNCQSLHGSKCSARLSAHSLPMTAFVPYDRSSGTLVDFAPLPEVADHHLHACNTEGLSALFPILPMSIYW